MFNNDLQIIHHPDYYSHILNRALLLATLEPIKVLFHWGFFLGGGGDILGIVNALLRSLGLN